MNPRPTLTGPGSPLHVLLTTDTVGGVWDFCITLARELGHLGQRVTLLALGEPTEAQRQEAAQADAWLVSRQLKLEWMSDSQADVRTSVALAERVIREVRPDVVHANQFALACIPAMPTVLTAHSDVLSWRSWNGHADPGGSLPPEHAGYTDVVQAGLRSASVVVAVSQFLADQIQALYQPASRLGVVHNGWPAGAGTPPPLEKRPRLTFLAGRVWDSAKNLVLAARVAATWRGPVLLGRVVLAGDQYHPDSGIGATISGPVENVGRISRRAVDSWLQQARVYLSPARYDPFGLLPVQAALAGCPLLLSDIPSYRELWEGAALFFRSSDEDDLRRKWGRLLEDGSLGAELASLAHARAQARFGATRMARDYLGLYHRAIANCPAAMTARPGLEAAAV